MLKDFLEKNKTVFKLVCGAGNECAEDVEKLTYVYSKAGAQIFDICAKPEILLSAKRGIERSGITKDKYICVSVGMKGDPHIAKATIDKSLCINCGICDRVCPNNAIKNQNIIESKCIGCSVCENKCPNKSISMVEKDIDLAVELPKLIEMGIDCIELHATSEYDEDIWEKWNIINRYYDGILSVCIDRLNLGNKQVLERIKKMLRQRKPYTTIIQADGIPMSGCDDEYKTTLQAVAMAEIIQDANLPVYIFISGGTNSKTSKLAKICNIDYKGIAIGSYARKLVRKDLMENNIDKAILLAKDLVKECLC